MRRSIIGIALITTMMSNIEAIVAQSQDYVGPSQRQYLNIADADDETSFTSSPSTKHLSPETHHGAYEQRMSYARQLIHERAQREAAARHKRIEQRRVSNQFIPYSTWVFSGYYAASPYRYVAAPARVYNPTPRKYYRLPSGRRNVRR